MNEEMLEPVEAAELPEKGSGSDPASPPESEVDEAPGAGEQKQNRTEEAEGLRAELDRARDRVIQLERERILLSQGVPEEDLDYYVFKIAKLVTEGKDFGAAAKEFLKKSGTQRRLLSQRSTGASLSGGAAKPNSTSETMNRLLRGQ